MKRVFIILSTWICSLVLGIYGAIIYPLLLVAVVIAGVIPAAIWAAYYTARYMVRLAHYKINDWSRTSNLDGSVRHQHILIVEDDDEVASLVAKEFVKLGCDVSVANSFETAVSEINERHYDLLILDWILDGDHLGGEVLKSAETYFDQFHSNLSSKSTNPTEVISFSSCAKEQINLFSSSNFEYSEHWQKPINISEIARKINLKVITE